jgi:hypothetical protein
MRQCIIAPTSNESYQRTTCVLCRPAPGLLGPVSGERIAPSGCSRMPTARFFEVVSPVELVYNQGYLAGPQSRNFKRYMARLNSHFA